ncbi:NUDIX domain-containing protein [Candidatus Daviesbacteria bacterium]|nr:NUDIX domain-containing protein [Candidatus Daviesbacteria bacterium]
MDIKYCYICGSELEKKSDALFICKKSAHHIYTNAKPCNGVIIENKKGEILLVKRKFPPKQGSWDLPGGFINPAESLEQSVVREIKEELEVELKREIYVKSYSDRYLFEGINYHTICVIFTGEIGEQIPKAADDALELKFFPKDKIPYSEIGFDGIKLALKDYLRI